MLIARRKFLFMAPAIVAATSLMKIKPFELLPKRDVTIYDLRESPYKPIYQRVNLPDGGYVMETYHREGDLAYLIGRKEYPKDPAAPVISKERDFWYPPKVVPANSIVPDHHWPTKTNWGIVSDFNYKTHDPVPGFLAGA